MKKHITVGLSVALLLVPALALAHDGEDHGPNVSIEVSTNAEAGVQHNQTDIDFVTRGSGAADLDRDGMPDVSARGSATGTAMKEEKHGGDTSDGRMYKGNASTTHENSSSTPQRKKFGWGFLAKWFGSHEEGPVGMSASSTPSENPPRAPRFETFLDKIMNIFKLDFFLKGKVENQ